METFELVRTIFTSIVLLVMVITVWWQWRVIKKLEKNRWSLDDFPTNGYLTYRGTKLFYREFRATRNPYAVQVIFESIPEHEDDTNVVIVKD